MFEIDFDLSHKKYIHSTNIRFISWKRFDAENYEFKKLGMNIN